MNPYGAFDLDDRLLPAFFFPEEPSQHGTQGLISSDASTDDGTIDPRLLQRDQDNSVSNFAGSKRKFGSIDPAVDSSASSGPRKLKRARKPSSLSTAVVAHDDGSEVDWSSMPAGIAAWKNDSTVDPSVMKNKYSTAGDVVATHPAAPTASTSEAGASKHPYPYTTSVLRYSSHRVEQPCTTSVPVSTSQLPLRAPVAPMSTASASKHQQAGATPVQTNVPTGYQLSAASYGSLGAAKSQQPLSGPGMPVNTASAKSFQPPAAPVAPMTTATSNQPAAKPNAPGRGKGTQTRIAEGKSNYGETIRNHALVTTMPPLQVDITLVEIMWFMPTWLQLPEVICRFARNGIQYKDIAKVQLYATDSFTKENVETVNNRLKWQSTNAKHLLYPDRADERITAIAKSLGPDTRYTADHWKLRCDYKPNAVKEPFEHIPLAAIYNAIDPNRWPQGNDRGALTKCLEHARANPDANYTTRDWATIIAQQGYTTAPVSPHVNRDQRDMTAFLGRCPQPT